VSDSGSLRSRGFRVEAYLLVDNSMAMVGKVRTKERLSRGRRLSGQQVVERRAAASQRANVM
jgi:hypothetical protein